jgi:hypothetical protein
MEDNCPPRIHIFLWLLAKNKIPTRDNLDKRRKLDDLTCLFCSEPETVHHLFIKCCVAHSNWSTMSEILGISVGRDFESIVELWLRDKLCAFVVNGLINGEIEKPSVPFLGLIVMSH